jgi:hypothetical protein
MQTFDMREDEGGDLAIPRLPPLPPLLPARPRPLYPIRTSPQPVYPARRSHPPSARRCQRSHGDQASRRPKMQPRLWLVLAAQLAGEAEDTRPTGQGRGRGSSTDR